MSAGSPIYPLRLTPAQRAELQQLATLRGDGAIATPLRAALRTHLDMEALVSETLHKRIGELTADHLRWILDHCKAAPPQRNHHEGQTVGALELLESLQKLEPSALGRLSLRVLKRWTRAERLAFDLWIGLVLGLELESERRKLLVAWLAGDADKGRTGRGTH